MITINGLRRYLIVRSVGFSRTIGKINDPFVTRWGDWSDVGEFRQVLRPGMVLVTRKRRELTNLFIPGHYTHAAIVSPDPSIIVEAIGIGVIRTTLESFVLNHDEILALEPVFADEALRLRAAQWALGMVGHKYDFLFDDSDGGDEAFFCAELAYRAYLLAETGPPTMRRYKTLGVLTVTADDFVRATDKWAIVHHSEKACLPEAK